MHRLHTTMRIAVAALLTLMSATVAARAQGGRSTDNVLYPQPVRPVWIGPEIGYGYWIDDGSFTVNDQSRSCVAFQNGKGGGLTLGLKMFLPVGDLLYVIPRVSLEDRGGSFTTPLPDEPTRDGNNQIVQLTQEASAKVGLTSLNFDLRIALRLGESGFYVGGGGLGGLLTGGAYDYSEHLTGPVGKTYTDNGATEHTLLTRVPFNSVKAYTLDLRGCAGYILPLKRFAINPEISYNFPLTSALNEPDRMKQQGFIFTVGILYDINPDN